LKNANGEDVLTLEDRRAALRAEIRRQQANFRLMASEFGLTPRSRVSLVVGSKDRDDNEDLLTKPAR
jgi:phage terminase small subunit